MSKETWGKTKFGVDLETYTIGGKSSKSKGGLSNINRQKSVFESIIVNKSKNKRGEQDINETIKDDANIDLEKIAKYFENVFNEQHFLKSYEQKWKNNPPIEDSSFIKQH